MTADGDNSRTDAERDGGAPARRRPAWAAFPHPPPLSAGDVATIVAASPRVRAAVLRCDAVEAQLRFTEADRLRDESAALHALWAAEREALGEVLGPEEAARLMQSVCYGARPIAPDAPGYVVELDGEGPSKW